MSETRRLTMVQTRDLLTADEARQMLEYVLASTPSATAAPPREKP